VLAFGLAVLLSLTDPVGDVPPPGVEPPQAAVYQEVGFADLTGFRIEEREGELWVGFRLDRTPNPAGAPLGFSLAVLADYIDLGPGGENLLPGARIEAETGADLAVVVTGWGAAAYPLAGGPPLSLTARREGDWIMVATGLKPGRYRHYPVVGIYDPFSPLGFRQPTAAGGLFAPKAPPGTPAVFDALYDERPLPPASARRKVSKEALVWGLAVLAGVFVAVGGLELRRARRAAA